MTRNFWVLGVWPLVCLAGATASGATPKAAVGRARAANYTPEAASFEVEVGQRLDNHEKRLGHLEQVALAPVASRRTPAGSGSAKPAGRSSAPGSGAGKAGAATHTVKSGETLFSISRRHGVSVADLMKVNRLTTASATIHPGQKLRIPGGGSPPAAPAAAASSRGRYGFDATRGEAETRHTVKPGDTISSLARRSGVSEQELMRLNGLKDPTKLQVGSSLRLPAGAGTATEPSGEAVPGETPDSIVESPDPLPEGWTWHRVQQGESLSQIAGRYGADRRAIERENELTGGSAALREGMTIKIPPPELASAQRVAPAPKAPARRTPAGEDESLLGYTVQKGDSVESLAGEFRTSAPIIRRLNRLGPTDHLVAGRRIVVPNTLFE